TFGVLLVRQLPGYRFLDLNTQIALGLAIAVSAAVWTWFWLALAAKPDHYTHAIAVAVMVASTTAIVVLRPMGIYPFYYAVILAGAAYAWRIGAILAAAVTVLAITVWWQTGMASPLSLAGIVILILLGGAAVVIRRYIGVQLELHETRDELRVIAAAEARRQLALDMHDQLGQSLTATVMHGELLAMDLPDDCSPELRARTQLIVDSSRTSLNLMREMVTGIQVPGLRTEVAVAEQLFRAAGIECDVDVRCPALPPTTDVAFGWVTREAITNVLRHSNAKTCTIAVSQHGSEYELIVADDGCGAADHTPGNGYHSITARMAAIGGSVRIDSPSSGGHRITAIAPTS
ncbi:MAG: histidine kinase, partial [Candidatus Nanopelagicales bacterium]